MKRLGIYVQVPFCQTKCTYCNFHTGVVAKERFRPYVAAVCREIREHRELVRAAGVTWGSGPSQESRGVNERFHGGTARGERPAPRSSGQASGENKETECVVDTVYFGGGTPSLLETRQLQDILEAIRETSGTNGLPSVEVDGGSATPPRTQRAGAEPNRDSARRRREEGGPNTSGQNNAVFQEVTLEADPETVEQAKAAAWVRAGINRVSFGVQSFSDKELKAAGRMHRRTDIYRAVAILRAAGIRNISFDLIAGLPHQTKDSWKQSLAQLISLAPEHVSVYLLEVDEGSRLGKELLTGGGRYSAGAVPSEDEMAEFYEMAQAALGAAGYRHYEISNWAKPGFEAKHNLKYWRREPYLGFGAGAHSFSGRQRWANAHDAAAYVRAIESGRLPLEQLETVTAEQALEEELFLGLRQLDGIDVGRIERDYGVTLGQRLEPLAAAGLLEREGDVVRLAEEKLSVSNEVFVELMK
jgi:oxygen-independent coproporphyrinogen III oxidase